MIKALLVILLFASPIMAQNPTGALTPWAPMQFTTAAGVIVPGGKLCTYAVGTSTPLKTYSDYTLMTENTNPIVMGSNGRPTTNGIYLQAASYKMVFRLPGSTTTCADGSIVWTVDGVYDLAQLMTLNFATRFDDKVCHASQWPGADAGAKQAACLAALPSTGGTIDVRGLEGAQAWAACPYTGTTKNVTVIYGMATHSIAASCSIPRNVSIVMSQGSVLSQAAATTLTIGGTVSGPRTQHFAGSGTFSFTTQLELYPEWWGCVASGAVDCSPGLTSAYAALPADGGVIKMGPGNYALSSAVTFSTLTKRVMVECAPASATTLTYTPLTGVALTFNYGNNGTYGLSVGHGIRDCNIVGPGNSTSTTGLIFGGSNGAQGFVWTDTRLSGFGIGVQMGSHTWVTNFRGGMIRDNGTNLSIPSSLTEAGENIVFSGVTFADAPAPSTNSVVVGSAVEVTFRDCSFDNAQLVVDNGTFVIVDGGHFEDPNAAGYPFIVISNNVSNYLRLIGVSMAQVQTTSLPTTLVNQLNGRLYVSGLNMFSSALLASFLNVANASNVEIVSFSDTSGQLTALITGSTSGEITNFAGAPYNYTIGSYPGGEKIDVTGNIRATGGSFKSTVATGTAPVVVTSTTPSTNLHAYPVTYSATGTQMVGAKIVQGRVTLSGGTAVVTFTGSAVYAGFLCTATVENANRSVAASAGNPTTTAVTFTGTGTDLIQYICIGN